MLPQIITRLTNNLMKLDTTVAQMITPIAIETIMIKKIFPK